MAVVTVLELINDILPDDQLESYDAIEAMLLSKEEPLKKAFSLQPISFHSVNSISEKALHSISLEHKPKMQKEHFDLKFANAELRYSIQLIFSV